MSDERELLEQEAKSKCFLEKPGGDVFMGTTEQFAPRAFAALRAVLDKCDELDDTDHPVARAFAQEFRYRIADALLAGDPR